MSMDFEEPDMSFEEALAADLLKLEQLGAFDDEERARVLLKAAYDILQKCNAETYVVDALTETAFYDEADCDGYCLMNDIEALLDLEAKL